MAKYVAAIDQGTTGTRCMLFDHAGAVVASRYEEHHQIYPQPGWVEHDPLEIWNKVKAVTQGALEDGQIDAAQLVALGITAGLRTEFGDVKVGNWILNDPIRHSR